MKSTKPIIRRAIAAVFSAILLIGGAMPASAADFDRDYSLSGTSADKMVSIASAQVGRNQGQMGYLDPWCARFVSDVAKIAGEKAAIPYNAGCRQLYDAVIAAGGKDVSSPQKGDIVFFVCTKCNTYSHVGIMVDSKGTCISGNYGRKVTRHSVKSYCGEPHSVSSGDVILKYVRPNYKNPSSGSAVTNKPSEYFNCNVSITCKNGIEVNLYHNPGDTSRASYFSKGQTASSTRGAKMTDSSTWYQITARDSSGAVKSYWLKYESSKMTVKDLSTPAPQTKPVTLKCNTSSVALDLSNKPSQKVTLTISGTVPEGSQMTTTISNPNVAAVNWGASSVGLVSSPTITAKAAGTTTITFAVTNGSTLAKTTVRVTVTAPSKPEYFDCNVEIQCVNGQIVNLYSDPGDISRVTYFSKGQTASSTRGARMSDGSTWYQILAQDSSGKVGTYWLKYESNKMTVHNVKNTYAVKYDANGGSGAPSTQTKTEGDTLTLSSQIPTRSGYTFEGWSTSSNGSVQYSPGGRYTLDQNITLYAVWNKNVSQPQYFSCNVQISCFNGETVNLYNNPGDSTRVDYFSKGQSVNSQYGAKLDDGTTWYQVTVNSNGTVKTLWLKYDVSKMTVRDILDSHTVYTVTYDANGGLGAPATQTKIEGEPLTLSSQTPIRSGYIFDGWATSRNGTVQYRAGDQYASDQNITLYAVWHTDIPSPSVISYRFDANSKTVEAGGLGATIKVYAVYDDGSSKDVTNSCNLYVADSSIAKLVNGVVFGLKAGTTYISISNTPSGIIAPLPIKITVINSTVAPKSIALWDNLINRNATGATIEVCEGEDSRIFKAVFDSATTKGQQVIWESSNESVLQVSSPNRIETRVVAKRPGTATLTVRTVDGSLSASCTIIVNPLEISISPANIELKVGQKTQVTISVFGTTFGSVRCTTADTNVATVKSDYVTVDGKQVFTITAVGPGTTVLTASSIYSWGENSTNGREKTITITVIN